MNRLTNWILGRWGIETPNNGIKAPYEFSAGKSTMADVGAYQDAIDKLAEYEDTDLDPIDVVLLRNDKEYWHREAIKWAAKLGEQRIQYAELMKQFGLPEIIGTDEELENLLKSYGSSIA